MMWSTLGLIATICFGICAAEGKVDYLCEHRHDGILLTHPKSCAHFVECFHNVAYVKECGSGLHFNPSKGYCDFKEYANCDSEPPDPTPSPSDPSPTDASPSQVPASPSQVPASPSEIPASPSNLPTHSTTTSETENTATLVDKEIVSVDQDPAQKRHGNNNIIKSVKVPSEEKGASQPSIISKDLFVNSLPAKNENDLKIVHEEERQQLFDSYKHSNLNELTQKETSHSLKKLKESSSNEIKKLPVVQMNDIKAPINMSTVNTPSLERDETLHALNDFGNPIAFENPPPLSPKEKVLLRLFSEGYNWDEVSKMPRSFQVPPNNDVSSKISNQDNVRFLRDRDQSFYGDPLAMYGGSMIDQIPVQQETIEPVRFHNFLAKSKNPVPVNDNGQLEEEVKKYLNAQNEYLKEHYNAEMGLYKEGSSPLENLETIQSLPDINEFVHGTEFDPKHAENLQRVVSFMKGDGNVTNISEKVLQSLGPQEIESLYHYLYPELVPDIDMPFTQKRKMAMSAKEGGNYNYQNSPNYHYPNYVPTRQWQEYPLKAQYQSSQTYSRPYPNYYDPYNAPKGAQGFHSGIFPGEYYEPESEEHEEEAYQPEQNAYQPPKHNTPKPKYLEAKQGYEEQERYQEPGRYNQEHERYSPEQERYPEPKREDYAAPRRDQSRYRSRENNNYRGNQGYHEGRNSVAPTFEETVFGYSNGRSQQPTVDHSYTSRPQYEEVEGMYGYVKPLVYSLPPRYPEPIPNYPQPYPARQPSTPEVLPKSSAKESVYVPPEISDWFNGNDNVPPPPEHNYMGLDPTASQRYDSPPPQYQYNRNMAVAPFASDHPTFSRPRNIYPQSLRRNGPRLPSAVQRSSVKYEDVVHGPDYIPRQYRPPPAPYPTPSPPVYARNRPPPPPYASRPYQQQLRRPYPSKYLHATPAQTFPEQNFRQNLERLEYISTDQEHLPNPDVLQRYQPALHNAWRAQPDHPTDSHRTYQQPDFQNTLQRSAPHHYSAVPQENFNPNRGLTEKEAMYLERLRALENNDRRREMERSRSRGEEAKRSRDDQGRSNERNNDRYYENNQEPPQGEEAQPNSDQGSNKPPPDFTQFPMQFLPTHFMGPQFGSFADTQDDVSVETTDAPSSEPDEKHNAPKIKDGGKNDDSNKDNGENLSHETSKRRKKRSNLKFLPYSQTEREETMDSYSRGITEEARSIIRDKLRKHMNYARKMQRVVDSKAFSYVSSFLNAKPYGKYLGLPAMYCLQTERMIAKRFKIKGGDLMRTLAKNVGRNFLHPLPSVARADEEMAVPESMDYCPYPVNWECDTYASYRSMDGSCNNLKYPIWGRSMLPFRRLVAAEYGDGLESMRRSVTGSMLPSPRVVSLHLFPDVDNKDQIHTLMLMNFGQIVDHDLTHTAITKMSMEEDGFSKETMTEVKCGYDGCESGTMDTEACWPIPIPDDDPDFRYNRCMKFVRSQEVPTLSCTFAPREQLNQVTTWLDASAVYGSTLEESERLRDPDTRRGRMVVAAHPHGNQWKPMLPKDPDVELCRETNATVQCFAAGDERVNEQAGLSAIHLMLVREHNRIEENLHLMNPHWDGERLYQETRRIISAAFQHIVYNEYLPIVLGPDAMYRYRLNLQKSGYSKGYNTNADPRPPNSFATAAYRFGHTLIDETVRRASKDLKFDDSLMLSEIFHRPKALYDTKTGGVDGFVRGMCESSCQHFDPFFTKQVSRSMFTEEPPHGLGMDLLSLNIMRGRDHGLPGYNDFREYCGLRRAYNFDDLKYEIPNQRTRSMLSKIYKNPDDIDLFAGGIAERSVEGGIVGPVFACIIGEHFRGIKEGDRFWFENEGKQAFSPAQMKEIRKSMFSKIMCTNSDDVNQIQPWVLYAPTVANDTDVPSLLKKLNDIEQHEVWFETLAFTNNYERNKNEPPKVFRELLKDEPKLLDKMFPRDSRVPVNFRVPCELLPSIDLSAWREGPYEH